ncbi:efflux RND transporter periplasmic adaptor subunit [Haliea sp.]|uniref:efflux RND transporter periplasmic adaptor subunit n=1 Tax=Haliea TaxID=475794 RepID=UPI00257BB150|nr:efflux RND transporter periplasmic adaptor subunit [Haliea sp.]|tara:strand:+ start:15756 stop:16874 length:1119 start_codon:yes stop_codon:yes gene_type:complete
MPVSLPRRYATFLLSLMVAVLATVLLTVAITLRAGSEAQPTPAPLPVAVLPFVEENRYTEAIQLSGIVQAKARAQLAFEVPGLLLDLTVEEGSAVTAGQILGRLDTRQLQAQINMASADLASVDAELQLARLRLERNERLRKTGAVSAQDYDEARLTADALENRKGAVLARLETLDIDLEKSALRAPYDGVVATRHLDPGTVLQAGEPVMQLVSVDALEARIGIPAARLSDLETGARYTLQLRTGAVEATLEALRRDVDTRTHTALAVFQLAPATEVLDGEVVSVTLNRSVQAQGGWVPVSALLEGERGAWTVLRIEEQHDGRHVALREAVEVLAVKADQAFVRGSLQAGHSVVADGIHRIAAGTTVQPVEY